MSPNHQQLHELIKREEQASGDLQRRENLRKNLHAQIVDQIYANFACDHQASAIYKQIQQVTNTNNQLVNSFQLWQFTFSSKN